MFALTIDVYKAVVFRKRTPAEVRQTNTTNKLQTHSRGTAHRSTALDDTTHHNTAQVQAASFGSSTLIMSLGCSVLLCVQFTPHHPRPAYYTVPSPSFPPLAQSALPAARRVSHSDIQQPRQEDGSVAARMEAHKQAWLAAQNTATAKQT